MRVTRKQKKKQFHYRFISAPRRIIRIYQHDNNNNNNNNRKHFSFSLFFLWLVRAPLSSLTVWCVKLSAVMDIHVPPPVSPHWAELTRTSRWDVWGLNHRLVPQTPQGPLLEQIVTRRAGQCRSQKHWTLNSLWKDWKMVNIKGTDYAHLIMYVALMSFHIELNQENEGRTDFTS